MSYSKAVIAAALSAVALATQQAPAPLIGATYFGGWYNCSGSPPNECFSHFQGFTPTGSPVSNFFPSYPSRSPLLG